MFSSDLNRTAESELELRHQLSPRALHVTHSHQAVAVTSWRSRAQSHPEVPHTCHWGIFSFVLFEIKRCNAALWACQGLGKGSAEAPPGTGPWAWHEQAQSMLTALALVDQPTSCIPDRDGCSGCSSLLPATRLPGTPGLNKVKITPQMQQSVQSDKIHPVAGAEGGACTFPARRNSTCAHQTTRIA